jgi:hypothetical protein
VACPHCGRARRQELEFAKLVADRCEAVVFVLTKDLRRILNA